MLSTVPWGRWRYHDYRGGYLEYCGEVFSTVGGYHEYRGGIHLLLFEYPKVPMISPTVLNTHYTGRDLLESSGPKL